jgi:uncharacterized membrane protein
MANPLIERMPPTETERVMACIAHAVSLPLPVIAPAVLYFIHRRTSRFVSAHALTAAFESVLLNVAIALVVGASFAITISQVYRMVMEGQDPTFEMVLGTALRAVGLWVGLGVVGLIYLVRTVVQAFRAYQGDEPRGFVAARLARRIARL